MKPSCGSFRKRFMRNPACWAIQSTSTCSVDTALFILDSNPSLSLRIWLMASRTARSATPFACGSLGGEVPNVVFPFLASLTAALNALIAGSPSLLIVSLTSAKPHFSINSAPLLTAHLSLGPLCVHLTQNVEPVERSLMMRNGRLPFRISL